MTWDSVIESLRSYVEELFYQKVREAKIIPSQLAISFSEFERIYLGSYHGDEVIKQSTFRQMLRWMEQNYTYYFDENASATLSIIKLITANPEKEISEGEIPSIVANLTIEGAGILPTISEYRPGDPEFNLLLNIIEGQLVLNKTDNIWYYRLGNTVYALKNGLGLSVSDISNLETLLSDINDSISSQGGSITTINQSIQSLQSSGSQNSSDISDLQLGIAQLPSDVLDSVAVDYYSKTQGDLRYSLSDHNHAGVYASVQNVTDLRDMVFDVDDYFLPEKIKPGSIETNMLSVGSRASQMGLDGIIIEPNYQGDKSKVNITSNSGILYHYAISDTIREWTITAVPITGLDDNTPYYIYAKCEKDDIHGAIEIDSTKRGVNDDINYYYFLIGILHKVISGVRAISLTYGQTTINGKFITTGRLQSADGLSYFDLDAGEILANNGTFRGVYRSINNDGDYIEISASYLKVYDNNDAMVLSLGRERPDVDPFIRILCETGGASPKDLLIEGNKVTYDDQNVFWITTDDLEFKKPIQLMNSSTDPGSAQKGWLYYNTTSNMLKCYNGSIWTNISEMGNLVNLSSDPAGSKGSIYFNTVSNKIRCYDGTTWQEVGWVM